MGIVMENFGIDLTNSSELLDRQCWLKIPLYTTFVKASLNCRNKICLFENMDELAMYHFFK